MHTHPASNLNGVRHIWEFDCVAITTVLAHGLPLDDLRALVEEFSCADCAEGLENAAWVLQTAHQTCHKENAFSHRVEAMLNHRFHETIWAIRGASCLAVVRRLADEPLTSKATIATQWALLTDPDPEKQKVGHHLAHALLLRGAEARPLAPRGGEPAATKTRELLVSNN